MSEENIIKNLEEEQFYTVKSFFEDVPPGRDVNIADLAIKSMYDYNLFLPELIMHCSDDLCKGRRLFKSNQCVQLTKKDGSNFFIHYRCKNCGQSPKVYSVWAFLNSDGKTGKLYKYGEIPEFGPPTPAKVVSILGEERDYYFKGRRAENQGLGIAAFAYYRRVVENQKNKIFEEIIRTIKKVEPANLKSLEELEAAKAEQQFSKAVDLIKHGIPQALLIGGHNPLLLLHSALSDGIHAKKDEDCLEIATSIRIILTDLVERISSAVKDTKELKTALSRILKSKK